MTFIKSYFGKTQNQVTEKDVELFIAKKIEESKNLEYKQINILRDAKNLCKHVCAFANSEGGLLLVGISEKKESHRIYPDKITWGDPSYTKEQLENILLGNISPHVNTDIVPIRKSDDDQSVIFLIDVPKSNELHMTKDRFYKRVNFQSLPMSREEIISFIRDRLKFDECAMFRFQLKAFIFEVVDEMFYRIIPGFSSEEKRKQLEKEMITTIEQTLENWKEIKYSIFEKTPIINIIRFGDSLETVYTHDITRIERYPKEDITIEEKILLIELKDNWDESALSYLRKFFIDDSEFHKIECDWRQSPLEFEKKTNHKDHVRDALRGGLFHLRVMLENFLKILKKHYELESRYGLFRQSTSVKTYFDYD